jgi:ABC-type nitrate/sulfonate/bicarbonate transport system substrate-binding protein
MSCDDEKGISQNVSGHTRHGGAGSARGQRSPRAQGAETLNIGLSPFINQATIFMANDLGYFSKMGLDIRMKIFMDGAPGGCADAVR